jgi:hypothetical protein
MAPRKKKRTVRRSRTFRVLNALEAATYGAIVLQGTTGYSNPFSFFTDQADIGYENANVGIGSLQVMQLKGADQIGLQDIISNPGESMKALQNNLQANFIPMAIASFTTAVTFKLGKNLLRRPVASINRNIMKPLFGKAVAL